MDKILIFILLLSIMLSCQQPGDVVFYPEMSISYTDKSGNDLLKYLKIYSDKEIKDRGIKIENKKDVEVIITDDQGKIVKKDIYLTDSKSKRAHIILRIGETYRLNSKQEIRHYVLKLKIPEILGTHTDEFKITYRTDRNLFQSAWYNGKKMKYFTIDPAISDFSILYNGKPSACLGEKLRLVIPVDTAGIKPR